MNARFLLAALAALTASGAYAAPAANSGSEYITGTLGWYDATQQDNEATLFGAEYRLAPHSAIFGIRPTIGGFVTTDSSLYGYVGLHWDWELYPQIFLSPNFAAGVYSAGDDGKRLGGAIEFRSGIELEYQMENRHRVGLAFNHMSNASIYDDNPGVETLLLTYSVPTGRNFY